jgi:hypothetical protein
MLGPFTVSWDTKRRMPIVDKDNIFVDVRKGRQVITWKGDHSIRSFDIEGLMHTGEFDHQNNKPETKTVTIEDKATREEVFKYTIKGTSANGELGVNDPKITNGSTR